MTTLKQTHTYKTTTGSQINIDLHWIPGQENQPVILWLHGGALIFGSRDVLMPQQLEAYLQAGYAVAAADYRLAPETKLPSIVEDVQDAYHWLREYAPLHAPLDPNRIGVIGHSAGGYLTLMMGFCVQPCPRALVSLYGYGDIIGDWYSQPDSFYRQSPLVPENEAYASIGSSEFTGTTFDEPVSKRRSRFYLYCRQQGLWPQKVAGHDPFTEADWFRPYCPIQNVTPNYVPALLVHGDEDTDVPVEQSIQMTATLARQGVEHGLIVLPGEPHGFDYKGLSDPVVADVFQRILDFLQKHL